MALNQTLPNWCKLADERCLAWVGGLCFCAAHPQHPHGVCSDNASNDLLSSPLPFCTMCCKQCTIILCMKTIRCLLTLVCAGSKQCAHLCIHTGSEAEAADATNSSRSQGSVAILYRGLRDASAVFHPSSRAWSSSLEALSGGQRTLVNEHRFTSSVSCKGCGSPTRRQRSSTANGPQEISIWPSAINSACYVHAVIAVMLLIVISFSGLHQCICYHLWILLLESVATARIQSCTQSTNVPLSSPSPNADWFRMLHTEDLPILSLSPCLHVQVSLSLLLATACEGSRSSVLLMDEVSVVYIHYVVLIVVS